MLWVGTEQQQSDTATLGRLRGKIQESHSYSKSSSSSTESKIIWMYCADAEIHLPNPYGKSNSISTGFLKLVARLPPNSIHCIGSLTRYHHRVKVSLLVEKNSLVGTKKV